ncbi:MAG: DUF4340 domain-containing protein [Lachnospiraceae bacterium]|nr:DUF4340 domain-containing protein [Lachnospiraceae bacterium]
MASKKKKRKNMITLLSLCAVFVLLVVVYFAASKWKENDQGETDEVDTGIALLAVETGDISEIKAESSLFSYTIVAKENQWKFVGDEEFPLATAKIDTMAETLMDLRATSLVLADAGDLAEYGLAQPAITLTVTKKDGESSTLCIGDQSSADGGFYACVGGNKDVYLIGEETQEVFYVSEEELMQFDEVPVFTSDKAAGLKVVSDTYRPFTIKDSTNDLKDLTAMALYTMALYDVYEKPVRVDLTNFSTLMENYTSIGLGEFITYHAADAASYGLSSPTTALTVWYEEEGEEQTKDFTLYFGSRTEDGSGVYVRLEGSNQIFLMAAETAETLLSADIFSVISRFTQMVNITSISGLTVRYKDSERVFGMTHEKVEQEDGSITTNDTFTVDGMELDKEGSDAFRDLYQAIIAVAIEAELPDGAAVGTDEVLALIFFEDGTNEVMHEVRYLSIEGDNTHYAVEENGLCLFMADAAAVDELVAKIKEYQP